MIKDQCISVTDLRTKTKQCVEGLENSPKYIFVNNKPVAVLIDIEEYEENFLKPKLVELSRDEVSDGMQKKAEKARNSKQSDLINI